MTLAEFQNALNTVDSLTFILPNGESIPAHFHITELGRTTKHFIDCGSTVREEQYATLQLWYADDTEHRLTVSKLQGIVNTGQRLFRLQEEELQIEYQGNTKELYAIKRAGNTFHLTPVFTDCLAKEQCGIPTEKPKVALASLGNNECDPNSGCC